MAGARRVCRQVPRRQRQGLCSSPPAHTSRRGATCLVVVVAAAAAAAVVVVLHLLLLLIPTPSLRWQVQFTVPKSSSGATVELAPQAKGQTWEYDDSSKTVTWNVKRFMGRSMQQIVCRRAEVT